MTTSVRSTASSTTTTTSNKGAPPVQPTLVSSDIPMLPGRYIQFYQNIAQTIQDVEAARKTEEEQSVQKALEKLFVKPSEIVNTTKCILLARQSALQGKTLRWE